MHYALTLSAVALMCFGSGATNAQTVPASIPTPLVNALLDNGFSGMRDAPRYYVGELPTGFPASLVPSGPVSVVGGMKSGGQLVAVLADSTRRLAAVFEQMLEESGWTRPAPERGSGFSSVSGPSSYFCKDSAMVSAVPLAGSERSYIRVNYQTTRGRSPCSFNTPPPSRTQLTLPVLTPPKDVRAIRMGGGSGGSEVSSRAQLTGSKLEPSAIVAHYSAQLKSAGWSIGAPAVSEQIAAQRLEAKDESGAWWEGALVAFSRGSGIEVSLSMQPRAQR